MKREEVTSKLSRLAEKHISRRCALWAPEVDVPVLKDGMKIGRVDFAGFTPYGYGLGCVPDAAFLERGKLTCYEVKSCMPDYNSGHGLNFVGDVNWLVCPVELFESLRESLSLPSNAGVLCPDSGWGRLIVRIENPATSYPEIRRSMTAAEAIWRIAKASFGARVGVEQ